MSAIFHQVYLKIGNAQREGLLYCCMLRAIPELYSHETLPIIIAEAIVLEEPSATSKVDRRDVFVTRWPSAKKALNSSLESSGSLFVKFDKPPRYEKSYLANITC
ncbi:hypothetical protein KIL84_009304 [Mauremys mutica]|uniref:Uncharacterized protein n=1 Tax=Mauremys mutica TaxID=74926 RepID=A0A9D3XIF4_9SAUR|nr:hypothetical protein KIL84_009304 [Mauremys mutica]